MKNDKDGSNDDLGINYDDNDYDVNSEQMTENILLLCIFSLKKRAEIFGQSTHRLVNRRITSF